VVGLLITKLGLRFDRIADMSLWLHSFGPPCISMDSASEQVIIESPKHEITWNMLIQFVRSLLRRESMSRTRDVRATGINDFRIVESRDNPATVHAVHAPVG